jgi:hypothetical protein
MTASRGCADVVVVVIVRLFEASDGRDITQLPSSLNTA